MTRELSHAVDELTVRKLNRAIAGDKVGEAWDALEKSTPETFKACYSTYMDAVVVWNMSIYACAEAEVAYLLLHRQETGENPPLFKP